MLSLDVFFVSLIAIGFGVGSSLSLILQRSCFCIRICWFGIPDNLWYTVAQDRQLWREREQSFVESKSLRLRGAAQALEDRALDGDLQLVLRAPEDEQSV